MASSDPDTLLDTIARLAEEIARASPECADKARQIATLAAEVNCARIDRSLIRDAIEAETSDSDLSDTQVGRTAEAVARAVRDPY